MMRKTKFSSISLEPDRHQKWKRIAANSGVSPNEIIGLLIDAVDEEAVKKPVVKMNGAGILSEAGAIR